MQACEARDVPRVESKIKRENYARVMHLISHPEPDQRMISTLQRNLQPVDYERFDGAAVVTYKVGQRRPAGPTQPEAPSSLPGQ